MKKFTRLFCVFCMLVMSLAACGSDATPSTTESSSSTTTTTTESAKKPTPPIEDDGLGEVL